MRYTAEHPDPELRYFANVHIGAVPSSGMACVRAGSQILRPASDKNRRRTYENPKAFNWGVVILYSIETAEPLALMHEFQLSGLRVGATTGMAVDAMTPKNASRLGLFGVGKQAGRALEAITAVRQIEQIKVYSPNPDHRMQFVKKAAQKGLSVTAAADPRDVVVGADIVCCATSAMSPVFNGEWLQQGQFVVTIANSDVTNKRSEVDPLTFTRASAIIVNDWESVVENQQTELLDLIETKRVRKQQVFELGDVITGKAAPDLSGIVYYKNNSGLAIQFAAAGALAYARARELGDCKEIPTEWLGSDLSGYYEAGFRPSP
jgi:ornithine cyclodeaminase/alanine dehydrogenase